MSNMTNMVTSEKHGVQNFIKIHTEIDPTGIITKEKLYSEYHTWCLITAHTPLTRGSFSKALNQLQLKPNLATQMRLQHLATTRRTINGIRTWCWAGIKLKETSESNENQS